MKNLATNRTTHRQAGFTLIEMLVAIAVIAIATGTASLLPAVQRTPAASPTVTATSAQGH